MEWISVKEKLPVHGQPIAGTATFGHTWTEFFDIDEPLGKMTHWKPRYTSIASGPAKEDDEEDVFIDIGYRQNTPEQNYILRTVRLKEVGNKTLSEIYKMLESEEEE